MEPQDQDLDIEALKNIQQKFEETRNQEASADLSAPELAEISFEKDEKQVLAELQSITRELEDLGGHEIEGRIRQAKRARVIRTQKEQELERAVQKKIDLEQKLQQVQTFIAGKGDDEIANEVKRMIQLIEKKITGAESEAQALGKMIGELEKHLLSDNQLAQAEELLKIIKHTEGAVEEIKTSDILKTLIETAEDVERVEQKHEKIIEKPKKSETQVSDADIEQVSKKQEHLNERIAEDRQREEIFDKEPKEQEASEKISASGDSKSRLSQLKKLVADMEVAEEELQKLGRLYKDRSLNEMHDELDALRDRTRRISTLVTQLRTIDNESPALLDFQKRGNLQRQRQSILAKLASELGAPENASKIRFSDVEAQLHDFERHGDQLERAIAAKRVLLSADKKAILLEIEKIEKGI